MTHRFMSQPSSVKKYRLLVLIAGVVVVFDQISKFIIVKSVPLFHSITVIPGFFNITHIRNPGGAFGFLAGSHSSLQHLIFLFVSSAAIGLIFYFFKKTPYSYRFLSSALALVFGGAIGNMIDRIRMGSVVDFLDFYVGNLHWPAFNIADSAVSIGMIIFLFYLVFKKLPE